MTEQCRPDVADLPQLDDLPDDEHWRPIPGWRGEYHFRHDGTVVTVGRTITRKDGTKYRIKPRIRRWVRDHRTGRAYMKLCRGGRYTGVWRHLLMAEVWGDVTGEQAAA